MSSPMFLIRAGGRGIGGRCLRNWSQVIYKTKEIEKDLSIFLEESKFSEADQDRLLLN